MMRFRFILRPGMAVIAALHDGREGCETRTLGYIFALLSTTSERVGCSAQGVNFDVLSGLCMDTVYQLIVLSAFLSSTGVRRGYRSLALRACAVADRPPMVAT